jgi:hypothetical protein
VIAKNAAHRTFTQAGTSGQTSIEDNIDMFRSLAVRYNVGKVRDLTLERNAPMRISRLLEQANNISNQDLSKVNSGKVYRVFKSTSLSHVDAHYTLIEKDNGYLFTSKSVSRLNPNMVSPHNKSVSKFISHEKGNAFVKEIENIDVCSNSFERSIGLDGISWLVEVSDNGKHCADYLWGGNNPKKLEVLIKEIDYFLGG